jgi:hypothetical protein
MTPELGLTQYRFGAVVLILKQTFRSEGFRSVIVDETAVVKGPTKVSSVGGSICKICSGFDMMIIQTFVSSVGCSSRGFLKKVKHLWKSELNLDPWQGRDDESGC